MAEDASSKTFQLYRIAYSLIFCRSLREVFEVAAKDLAKAVRAANSILWIFNAEDGSLDPTSIHAEEKGIKTRSVSPRADYLGECFRSGKPTILRLETLKEPTKHIQLPKEMVPYSGLLVPFKGRPEMQGVLELINKSDPLVSFAEEDADFLTKSLELVTVAAGNMQSYEDQSRNQLNAITRLTLLYDISQIFNSTLELDQLLPIITEKIREILDGETCTIWFQDDTDQAFHCGKSTGEYEDLFSRYRAKMDEDVAGEAIQNGEGILLEDASAEERLSRRFPESEENPVDTYIVAPLECKGKILGAVEVLNRLTDSTYNEEDQFLLNDLSHQAAVSIHNANLLRTERKAKELDSLLSISHEITSTLNLDRVLLTIVNQSATVVPYDRAAIAMVEQGKVQLASVSGKMEVDPKSPDMRDLHEILTWCSHLEKGIYISELNENIVTDREENRQKFKTYFEKTGMKSFISIPLKDEEGDLGILCFESNQPYFMDERHLEVASILANQATVAIRNAQLYRQVPLISLMEPIMQKKARLMKMPKRRRQILYASIILILLLLLLPWNMKIGGEVTVLPEKTAPVTTEVEGIVKTVHVREGTPVKQGDLLADLEDSDYRLNLQERRTRRDVLLKQISRSRMLGDQASLRLEQIQLEQLDREIKFFERELQRTKIRAPVSGLIITHRIEERVGTLLKKGEEFCELADMDRPRAEITIDEDDLSYVEKGQRVRVKMIAYPTRQFYGEVTLLGAQVEEHNGHPIYRLEAQIDNPELLLVYGMVGQAKIETGHRSIGYVLLRRPFRFIWKKLWSWLP